MCLFFSVCLLCVVVWVFCEWVCVGVVGGVGGGGGGGWGVGGMAQSKI